MDLLREHPEKIDWDGLSNNPNAMDLLRANPKKINWIELSTNPNAIDLLLKNPRKIDWIMLSSNPAIFELDYQQMKYSKRELNNAIIAASKKNAEMSRNGIRH
jgi:ribosomal protein L24E